MPIQVTLALAAFVVAVPTIIGILTIVMPLVRKFVDANVNEKTAKQIADWTHEGYTLVAGIAKLTPTTIDDDVARVIKVVDDNMQGVHGRPLTDAEKKIVTTSVLAKHVDPSMPNLGGGDVRAVLSSTRPLGVPAGI